MKKKPQLRKATLKGKPFRNEMMIDNLRRILAHQRAQGREILDKALYQGAETTENQMDQLQASRLSHQEAWEIKREESLLIKPESEVTAKLKAED